MCSVSRKPDCVEITFPGNRMKGPVAIETAFRFIADATEVFPVSALPDMLSDESKLVLARRAIREGPLTIVGLEAAQQKAWCGQLGPWRGKRDSECNLLMRDARR